MIATPAYLPSPVLLNGVEYVVKSQKGQCINYDTCLNVDDLTYSLPYGMFLSNTNTIVDNIYDNYCYRFAKMLSLFSDRCGKDVDLMKPIFVKLLSFASALPLKAFNVDYSKETQTIYFRLLMTNGLRVSLNKSYDTIDDDLVAYSFSYNRRTIAINIADIRELKKSVINIIKECNFVA